MTSDAGYLSLLRVTSFCCFIVLVFLQQLYSYPFPWSDEWHLVPYAIGARPLSWDWLWMQHVDHRIPIQKLFQVYILRSSGFDFRSLVLINSILAYLMANLLISAVRTYRGYVQIGDFIVPLILMNPGLGPFSWGFYLQFMSSTLFALCALSLLLKNSYVISSICVLLLNFCGMNGVVLSIIIAFSLLACVYCARPIENNKYILYVFVTLLALSLFTSIGIMVNWQPSAAASTSFKLNNLIHIANNFFYLINPWTRRGIYLLINNLLYVMAIVFFAKKFWLSCRASKSFYINDFAILVIIMATFGMLSSIVIGRSEYWTLGLETHYGYLVVILPIVSWVALSVSVPRQFGITFGIFLVLLYGVLFIDNTKWKIISGKEDQQKVIAIHGDMINGMTISDFVDKYNKRFFYTDNEDIRRTVKEMIIMLKHTGIQPYAQLRE